MYDQPIKLKPGFDYLGVHLDSTLSFNTHINKKISDAKGICVRTANYVGARWGLKPASAMWIYKAVVRPKLTHGCLVWAKRLNDDVIRDKLNNLQKIGLITLGWVRKKTPVTSIEVIIHEMPFGEEQRIL